MNAPIRQVCGGCLRSVEVAPAVGSEDPNRCPFCGGPIHSQDDSTVQRGLTRAASGDLVEAEPGSSETAPEWAETWSRGNLGSLGRFQLRERLGDGGFGQVFLAYDPRLDRDVALKVLKQTNPTERVMERFFREARAAARLDHPNIVGVHDAGFDNGRCWVAFHFVNGRPLGWYRDHHRLDPPTAARILRDLADAVDHAHRQGILHRDLKPSNVLIDDLGRPRLIDFGLSRRCDLDSSLTRDGAVVGTPAYMSPEQALGFSKQADERSDVFSLGVIFFEILSGRRPTSSTSESEGQGASTRDSIRQPRTARPAPPSVRAIRSDVPRALDRICRRALADDPEQRYPSARALADDLDRWLLRHRGGGVRLSLAAGTYLAGLVTTALLVLALQVPPALLARRGNGLDRLAPPLTALAGSGQPAVPSQSPGPFVGNLGRHRYHLMDCPHILNLSEANRITIATPEEAAARGLLPCAHCKPPVSLEASRATPED